MVGCIVITIKQTNNNKIATNSTNIQDVRCYISGIILHSNLLDTLPVLNDLVHNYSAHNALNHDIKGVANDLGTIIDENNVIMRRLYDTACATNDMLLKMDICNFKVLYNHYQYHVNLAQAHGSLYLHVHGLYSLAGLQSLWLDQIYAGDLLPVEKNNLKVSIDTINLARRDLSSYYSSKLVENQNFNLNANHSVIMQEVTKLLKDNPFGN